MSQGKCSTASRMFHRFESLFFLSGTTCSTGSPGFPSVLTLLIIFSLLPFTCRNSLNIEEWRFVKSLGGDYKAGKAQCLPKGTGGRWPILWVKLAGSWECWLVPALGGTWAWIRNFSFVWSGRAAARNVEGVFSWGRWLVSMTSLMPSQRIITLWANHLILRRPFRPEGQQWNHKARAAPRAPHCAQPSASVGFNMESGAKGTIVCHFSFSNLENVAPIENE